MIARLIKAVRVWLWKRTLFARAEWRDLEGHNTAVAYVSVSEPLIDGLKHNEVQGEAVAQLVAEQAHESMLRLVRQRMEIGRYALSE